MKSVAWFFLGMGAVALAEPGSVGVIEIRGTINPATSSYLKRAISWAETQKSQALVVELDTPGGLVSSVREMAQSIDDARVPVVVYVTPAGASATSAGALLMLASHVAVMAPGTNIGAAHPVGSDGKQVEGAAGEKAVNDTVAFARGLAELRKRPVQLAEDVVRKSRSLTADAAMESKLVDVLASSRMELLEKIYDRTVALKSGERRLETRGRVSLALEMTWGEKLLHWVSHPNIVAVLMTLAMLLIYMELSNPGITFAGVLGAICLIVAFMAFQSIPIRVGGLALLGLGMVLMIAELFVTTHGVLAAGGVGSFLLGMLWLIDSSRTDLSVSLAVLIPATLALAGGASVLVYAATRTRRLAAETRKRIGGSLASGLQGYGGEVVAVEGDGRHGKIRVRGEIWNYESLEPLSPHVHVRVDEVQGFQVKVSRLSSVPVGSKKSE